MFIGALLSVFMLLPRSTEASSSFSLSPEQLVEQIESAQSIQRDHLRKASSGPKQNLTIKQKAQVRERKRKQFTEMLLKFEKAEESMKKQIEAKKQPKAKRLR